MTPERKEQLRKAATLVLMQRVKNAAAIHCLLSGAEDIAESMDHAPEWRAVVEAIRGVMDKLPGDAADFARVVLDLDPEEWDHFTGFDYDELVDEERASRGLKPPTENGDAMPYEESPASILRRLRGLSNDPIDIVERS